MPLCYKLCLVAFSLIRSRSIPQMVAVVMIIMRWWIYNESSLHSPHCVNFCGDQFFVNVDNKEVKNQKNLALLLFELFLYCGNYSKHLEVMESPCQVCCRAYLHGSLSVMWETKPERKNEKITSLLIVTLTSIAHTMIRFLLQTPSNYQLIKFCHETQKRWLHMGKFSTKSMFLQNGISKKS